MCWFGERCIYPGPHYLEAEKQVSRQRRDVDGRNRNYQKLTSSGRKRLAELSSEWKRVTTGVFHPWPKLLFALVPLTIICGILFPVYP